MNLRSNTQNFGVIAKTFHWVMAIMIISLLAVGLIMTGMENTPDKFKLYATHKSVGIIVLFLAIARLGWKIMDFSPLLPDHMDKFAKLGAKLSHVLLYVLMFAMPLSGWLMSSASGFPVSVFGWFLMPNFVGTDRDFAHDMNEVHEYLAWLLMGLIAMHMAAALFHHFYYKDNILKRMLPNFKGKPDAEN